MSDKKLKAKKDLFYEIDYDLTIKHQPGTNIPEEEFNEFVKEIEEKMSDGKFLVVVTSLDPGEYSIEN